MEHNHHTDGKRLGVIIFGVLAALTVVEYIVAVYIPLIFLLGVIALGKAGLVVYYYMHVYKLGQDDEHTDHEGYAFKTNTNRLGLWLFLVSDSFVFGGLFITRFSLVGTDAMGLNQLLGLIVTAVLLISSFFMNRAEVSMAQGDKKGFVSGTLITFILGLAFLVGVIVLEWRMVPVVADKVMHLIGATEEVHLTPSSSIAGAVFFMMTGMHAFHVLTGLIFLLVVLRKGQRDYYTPEKYFGVEAAAVYWHFVDVVWIFFYPALYLVGAAAGG
jgi:cytochrome c oxidase subunit 3